MKKGTLLFLSFLMVISLLTVTMEDHAYAAYPDTVRVGLYYGKDQVSSVSFNSKAGLEVGYYSNGAFTPLWTEAAGKTVVIRKDAYFIRSAAGVTTEYNPAEGIPYEGVTSGPYHVQIGSAAPDLVTAQALADTMKASGVKAYPAYDNGWYVWTGFYSDIDKANAAVVETANKLGIAAVTVVPPSSARLILLNDAFEEKMVFTSSDLKLRVRPNAASNPYLLSVNGKQYRGEFEIRRYLDSDLTVINILNLEQYLYGVVPGEMEATAPLEALKAQAVSARTYTFMNIGKYSKWGFDVVDTVDSQVYGGYEAERPSTNTAVDQTQGKKAVYGGKLASLFYYSSSGGMTEDNVNVWGTAVPYLKSVPDPYESGRSYNYNWTKTLTAADIKLILFVSGVEIGDIVSVTAEEYSPAGRVIKLKIVGTQNQITYYKDDGKVLLGLPSQMFTINGSAPSGTATSALVALAGDGTTNSVNPSGAVVVSADGTMTLGASDQFMAVTSTGTSVIGTTTTMTSTSGGNSSTGTYVFTGKGWGHGVGMSQEGAKGFALQGYTYDQILKHYFTGISVE